jgi:hypothetical protein
VWETRRSAPECSEVMRGMATEAVISAAMELGSKDNLTAVLIPFAGFLSENFKPK